MHTRYFSFIVFTDNTGDPDSGDCRPETMSNGSSSHSEYDAYAHTHTHTHTSMYVCVCVCVSKYGQSVFTMITLL